MDSISSAKIYIICITPGIVLIQVKSTLVAWSELVSICSGGMLGLFLHGAIFKTQISRI